MLAATVRRRALPLALALFSLPTMTSAQSTAKWSLCGNGRLDLVAEGQSVGSETFTVTCHPDGRYTATGRTQLSGGGTGMDLTTNVELGRDLLPVSASAKGTVQGKPFEQSVALVNGTATITTNGASQTVPYAPGASWVGANIFYLNLFVAARYDESKAGVQEFDVFPALKVSIERSGRYDGVATGTTKPVSYDRFSMKIAAQSVEVWRDEAGRLAGFSVPSQRFVAARPDAAGLVNAFTDQLTNPSPTRPSSPASSAANAIDYSAQPTAPYTAEEVTVPVSGTSYTLAGTLLVPKAGKRPYPAVVMVTGSGLQTRDSRIPIPGLQEYAPFRQIAERLASNGVAVLRADDRGVGGSTGRETLESATTSTLATDTRAQIAWLRNRSEIDANRIIIIGHSEGASIAAMIGANDPKISALVLMAGVAKRGAEVATQQQEDILRADTSLSDSTKAALRAQQRRAVAAILSGGDVPGQPVNAWTREYMTYDPLPTVRKVKQPVLILQGERDRQVDQSHAMLLAEALRGAGNSRVRVTKFPTLNHLFLPSKTGSVAEYSQLESSVVPSNVIDAIERWVTSQLAPRK